MTFASHFIRAFSTSTSASTATKAVKPLYGTVASHSSYIFLHTNERPSTFPAKISSPVQRALQLSTIKLGTIVNFAWTGESPSDRSRSRSEEITSATIFSSLGGRLELPEVTLENLYDVENKVKNHILNGQVTNETGDEVHLYVCTHGERDCRCGKTGGQVVKVLREEVERRKIGGKVKVREVGHVGGHKYAANVLVYPQGEWLGELKPENVPAVLDAIAQLPVRPFTGQDPPILPSHWRGRMGLGKDEQLELFEKTQHIQGGQHN